VYPPSSQKKDVPLGYSVQLSATHAMHREYAEIFVRMLVCRVHKTLGGEHYHWKGRISALRV
jgi:hypothetical protein